MRGISGPSPIPDEPIGPEGGVNPTYGNNEVPDTRVEELENVPLPSTPLKELGVSAQAVWLTALAERWKRG